ncbi:amino acid ABC transporter permease [Paenibacillus sp. CGMCC 1.16610]|uniref:Amino acid ABC transporter permease n=2 Tax=Paenibacillus TaxID=44249 RepID=A0ABU6D8X5_9BACL|nr:MULTISPECIES: amino acid ABC transporter permease [Paenibacillus]MBA2939481.1 amino acid ABC transporter permease [Paenibacillus sp. CGMCC 1.16610]MCY9656553.1 amino acid ABC transporter permease [Paenibacillus anseongense]MEB4794202.1 amino acid ABC transporter permease [Paenibacillus chondroitinus]MVQ39145.1 ABC transporter permease subunit [Paenibacillus anseongense]
MELVWQNLDFLLKGAYYTLLITVVSMFFGFILALVLAFARLKGNIVVRNIAMFYVSVFRGTPILVQIFIIYYGLPDYGIRLGPLTAAFLSLSLNIGAFLSETFRGAILSVSKGQTEAAMSLGLTPWQTTYKVVLPQAARVAIPPMGNTFIGMLKETSLVSIVTVTELLRTAQLLIAQYYIAMPFYIAIAIMYWIMSLLFSHLLTRIEKNLSKAY